MDSRFAPAAVAAFELFFRPWMRGRVRAVLVAGVPRDLPPDRPVLFVPNHVSWWDGFVMRRVQRVLRPGAPLFHLMSERELRRFPFFRRLGVVGIDAGSPSSAARALRCLEARLAERRDGCVVLFPQGRIWPSFRRPLGFERGVELFARRLSPLVLPVGIHPEPLNAVAPTFFVSVGEPVEGGVDARGLEARVEAELDALSAFLARHGEDAARAWPGPSGRLPR
jgi:1-acyl-sn-glycerol-3-phosphate acyltransferase